MQTILNFLKQVISVLVSMLPLSPFGGAIDDLSATVAASEWLPALNWLVPVGTLITIGTVWLGAIGIFYAYQLILRWAKVVSD